MKKILLAILICLLAGQAWGATQFTDATDDHKWSTAGNWSAGKPDRADAVTVATGVNSIIIDEEATVLSFDTTAATGNVSISGTGSLTVYGNFTLGSGDTWTNEGVLSISDLSTVLTNNVDIGSISSFVLNSGDVMTLGGDINIGSKTFNLYEGTLDLNGHVITAGKKYIGEQTTLQGPLVFSAHFENSDTITDGTPAGFNSNADQTWSRGSAEVTYSTTHNPAPGAVGSYNLKFHDTSNPDSYADIGCDVSFDAGTIVFDFYIGTELTNGSAVLRMTADANNVIYFDKEYVDERFGFSYAGSGVNSYIEINGVTTGVWRTVILKWDRTRNTFQYAKVGTISEITCPQGSAGCQQVAPTFTGSISSLRLASQGWIATDYYIDNFKIYNKWIANPNNRSIIDSVGGGKIILNGLTGTIFDTTTAANLTISNAPSIQVGDGTKTLTGNITFEGGGKTYGDLTVKKHAGNYDCIITGSNTFGALTLETPDATYQYSDLQITAGTTQTVTSLVAVGTESYLPQFISTSAGNAATISDTTGTNSVQYCYIKDSIVSGGATFKAISSTNVSGNTGWTFSNPSFTLGGSGGTITLGSGGTATIGEP